MITLPNFLSFCRIPLALVFFQENPLYRAIAIILALATDGLDGYLARKRKQISQFGAMLDPISDKFFVLVALGVLIAEGRMEIWQALTLLSRDSAVLLFSIYLFASNKLASYHVRAIMTGKITTVLLSGLIFLLVFDVSIPSICYFLFTFLGVGALIELYVDRNFLPKALET